MKKTLVAIAALAAFGAQAQSTVTLSGNIDFASANSSGTQLVNKGKTVSTTVGTSSTSVIKITAVEDLGGGTKVTGHYGLDPRPLSNDSFGVTNNTGASGATAGKTLGNTSTGLARDELFVGIAGAYGNIRLGAPNAMGLEVAGDASPLGTGVGSGYTGGGIAGTMMNSVVNTRYSRSVRYDSPAIMGLTASVLFAPGNDNAAITPTTVTAGDSTAMGIINARKTTELGLKYNNGPLNVSVANIKQSAQVNKTGWYSGAQAAAAQPKETAATIAAVNYKIADTTLYAGYNTGDRLAVKSSTDGSAAQSKGTRFAVKQTMGQFDLIAQQTTQKVTGDSATNDVKSKVTGLRADYNLSKTAAAYVGYDKWNTAKTYADVTAPTTTGDRKIVSIGLRKSF